MATTATLSAERDADRFTRSALTADSAITPMADLTDWLADRGSAQRYTVRPVPLDSLAQWHRDPDTGDLRHDSNGFFTIAGLAVRTDQPWRPNWSQPIIVQPEVGILGILVKEFHGVLHCLMQAKMEPGNVNGIQLSPTVQATRSNYTGVHRGRRTRYLDFFAPQPRSGVLVDVLQSEQSSWFLHKRNRNTVVETTQDVPEHDDFRWLTLGQIRRLLRTSNLINMDARTVLSCIPFAPADDDRDGLSAALLRSMDRRYGSVHATSDLLHWITAVRSTRELVQRPVPLREVADWSWRDGRICHRDRQFFTVLGVDVESAGREVRRWSQPLLAPVGQGIAALLVARIDGVLHALLHAEVRAGTLNVAELGPTVNCLPNNYLDAPAEGQPRYLDDVLAAEPSRIRYDAVLSEEGGRFYHAQNRYLIVEADPGMPVGDEHRWLAVHQIDELLTHSNYLTVEARTLVACLHALW